MIHAGQIRKGHRCCAAMNVSMIDVIREHTMRCMRRSRVVFLHTRHVRLHSRIRNGEVVGTVENPTISPASLMPLPWLSVPSGSSIVVKMHIRLDSLKLGVMLD